MSDKGMNDDAQNPPPRRLWVSWLLGILLALVLGGGVAVYQVADFLYSGGSIRATDVEVTISPGTPFYELAEELEAQGVVSDAQKFGWFARWMEQTDKIKSGRFRVNTSWTPDKVLDHLVNGTPLLERLTIPEGLTWWETGRLLEGAGFVRFEDFKKLVHDPEFLRHWGIPFPTAEGFLFPDTYLLMRPLTLDEASAKRVVGRLIDTFWRRVATLWPDGKIPPKQSDAVKTLVTMASIIEKETAVPSERERVSGVYANRLKIGMLLQADPTIAYGLGEGFKERLRRRHLDDASNPYNTYKHKGLPPSPICSAGLACLKAALYPESHDYYYFVARGDGSHEFNSNLKAHNRAVQMYQVNPTPTQ